MTAPLTLDGWRRFCGEIEELPSAERSIRAATEGELWLGTPPELRPVTVDAAPECWELAGALRVEAKLQSLANLSLPPHATHLDLSGCADLESLVGAAQLDGRERLRSLDVSGAGLRSFEGAPGLSGLTRIEGRGLGRVLSLQGLGELPVLAYLDLRGATALRKLGGLTGSRALLDLNLADAKLLRSLRDLAKLPALTRLDVSGTAVSSLRDVGRMEGLRGLNIARCDVRDQLETLAKLSLERLDVSGFFRAVPALPPLPTLVELVCDEGRHDPQVRGLERFEALRRLSLVNTWVANLEELTALPQLQALDLRRQSRDQPPTAKGLERLDLSLLRANFRRGRLEELRSLTSLEHLELHGCDEFPGLDGSLPHLVHVSLIGCGSLRNLNFLRDATHLEHLEVRGAKVLPRLESVAMKKELRYLSIRGCHALGSGDVVAELPALRSLNIDEETARRFDLFARLPRLEELSCSGLSSFEGMAGLTALRSLTAFGSSAKTLAGLGPMPSLRYLDVDHSPDLELDGLGGLPGLEELRIRRNGGPEDLSPLASTPRVRRLAVHVTTSSLATLPPHPELRHIEVSPWFDVPSLAHLLVLPRLRGLVVASACKAPGTPSTRHTRAGIIESLGDGALESEPPVKPSFEIDAIDAPGFFFSWDFALETGSGNAFGNFGFEPLLATDGSGHAGIVRPVTPEGPMDALVYWDEEEGAGQTFSRAIWRWLSGWTATMHMPEGALLENERGPLREYAERVRDDAFDSVADALLGGADAAEVWTLIDPGGPIARFHTAKRDLPLSDGDGWWALIEALPNYNAPLAHVLGHGSDDVRVAAALIRRRIKFDLGHQRLDYLERAAAVLSKAAHADRARRPILDAPLDPGAWLKAAENLAHADNTAGATTAYENALTLGGVDVWPEVYGALLELFVGDRAPSYRAYLESLG